MKFVAYLAGGSILTALVFGGISGLVGLGAEKEIWFGMLGPTLASVISWVAIERQRRLNPQKILKCLIKAFVIKFLLFGVYIAVLVKTTQVRPGLFIGCFAFFYLALHAAEAFELRRVQTRLITNNVNKQ
ncbi:MAG: hypothetical protein LBJ21_03655 [Acidobacteriota bacterium]|jgi:hypothetical protein|nr:hypothetical protein [Acidobacteriota bacterium]